MKSLFEQLGGTYTRQGDYCLPNVCLPPEEERPIGVYGQRRRVYLKKHHRVLYYNLLTAGMLDGHLADIEEQTQELFLRLVEQYADTEGVTEALKADDPMAWVRKTNNIRSVATEIIFEEIIYT
nr:TnpV protein [Ruminococcus bromii]